MKRLIPEVKEEILRLESAPKGVTPSFALSIQEKDHREEDLLIPTLSQVQNLLKYYRQSGMKNLTDMERVWDLLLNDDEVLFSLFNIILFHRFILSNTSSGEKVCHISKEL